MQQNLLVNFIPTQNCNFRKLVLSYDERFLYYINYLANKTSIVEIIGYLLSVISSILTYAFKIWMEIVALKQNYLKSFCSSGIQRKIYSLARCCPLFVLTFIA